MTRSTETMTQPSAYLLKRLVRLCFLPSVLVAVGGIAMPQSTPPTQSEVQAVYLYNFAKFVRWPQESKHDALTICIVGDKIYSDTLTRVVAGEHIEGHPLAVRFIEQPADEAGCDILFIGLAAKEHLTSLLANAINKPMLTVSDIPGFVGQGGMIQFLLIDNRVRFSVDIRAVQRSGIDLSSELLKVAAKVSGNTTGGPKP